MISNLYSLKDMIAEFYSPPFLAANDATAVRSVEQAILGGQGNIAKYPEHFQLYMVARYDDSHGGVIPCEPELTAECGNMKPKLDSPFDPPFDVTNREP